MSQFIHFSALSRSQFVTVTIINTIYRLLYKRCQIRAN
jgi:hypothetical protein